MRELKKCPFCEEEPKLFSPSAKSVMCRNTDCPICGVLFHVDEWQSRPIEDAQAARIAELEAQVAELVEACRAALLHIETNGVGTWPDDKAMMDTLRAAIEKAGGHD